MEWKKEIKLNLQGKIDKEIWIRKRGKKADKYPMDIYLGKKTDIIGLKKEIVDSIKKQLSFYSKTRKKLYEQDKSKMEYVSKCPITGIKTEKAKQILNIYGANYVQTPDTGHVYLKYIPKRKAINDFYLSNVNYASTYTNKKNAEIRLNSIAVPWAKWAIEIYKNKYKKMPKKILDVGSGAGHFVEACRRMNLDANGIELSESSRKFAKNAWGFDLDGRNFENAFKDYIGYDIITFWGLLEHTPNPKKILKIAHKIVSKSKNGGMVIAKLPRWLSLSSAVQRLNPDTVIRHIDPMGHLMLFTDASAAELFYGCDFEPISAWYYGMDIYETLMQIGNRTKNYFPLLSTKDFQIELQQFIDENRFSDGLTLVGVPKKR